MVLNVSAVSLHHKVKTQRESMVEMSTNRESKLLPGYILKRELPEPFLHQKGNKRRRSFCKNPRLQWFLSERAS